MNKRSTIHKRNMVLSILLIGIVVAGAVYMAFEVHAFNGVIEKMNDKLYDFTKSSILLEGALPSAPATDGINLNEFPMLEVKVPEVDRSAYLDDDSDGVFNKDDIYPGENDLNYVDSDLDGVVDAMDKYPGNDLDYEDIDMDGVIDSQDSDTMKATDIDHDGVDDAFDGEDNRSFYVKVLDYLGLIW